MLLIGGTHEEGLVMTQQSRRSTSARSSSVNNYDAREMALRLNKSVAKAAEDSHQEEVRCKIEAKVQLRQKLHKKTEQPIHKTFG